MASCCLSDENPAPLGSANPGSTDESSRADHVHPAPSAAALGIPTFASVSQRIQHSDLTDAVSGEAQAINVGSALPANAVVFAHEVKLDTQFTGGSVSACTLKLGGTDTVALVNAFDIKDSTASGKRYSPGYEHGTIHGDHCTGMFSSEQLVATVTPTGDSLSHLAAGDLTITVWYFVP